MKKPFILSLIIIFMSINAQAIQYYDGAQEHEIKTTVNETVSIWDGSIIPGDHAGGPTIVNLLSGGGVPDVDIHDTSSFNVFTGGEVFGSVHSYNESNFTIYDGIVDEVRLYECSHGSILGGSVSSVVAGHESSVDISDGIFDQVLGAGNTHISVTGGQFNGFMFVEGDNYTFEMSGGYTGVVDGSGAGYTTITGGEIDALVSNLSGIVEVFGGQINHLGAGDYSNSGLIIIHGTDFNYDYGYITDLTGTLTGTLLTGETINTDFERYGDAQILLVPEPAMVVLLALGGLALRRER